MKKPHLIHFVNLPDKSNLWIIAETVCGIFWTDADEFRSNDSPHLQDVTCNKCKKRINQLIFNQ